VGLRVCSKGCTIKDSEILDSNVRKMNESGWLDRIKKEEQLNIDKLRSKEGYLYAGLPWFKELFGRDALIAGWQLLDYDASISKNTLRLLSSYQGEKINWKTDEAPGKILHVFDYTPANLALRLLAKFVHSFIYPFPYYGSADATPLFVLVASEYLQKTGDKQLVEEIWSHIENAVKWLIRYGDLDEDGFIEYKRGSPLGVKNQNWKDALPYINMKPPVAAVEIQGYAYAAFQEASRMARQLGKDSYDWDERARKLKQEFNERFWVEDLNFFALALDGEKKPVTEIASNPGHLLFTGIMDKEKEKKVVERLFQEDMFTPYGIRTHSTLSKHFDVRACHLGAIWPNDNWVIGFGLEKCGYVDEAGKIYAAMIRLYQQLGCLPEFIHVVDGKPAIRRSYKRFLGLYIPFRKPCYPQAWATGALWNIANKLIAEQHALG
jgi:glycogen debranching enzyme